MRKLLYLLAFVLSVLAFSQTARAEENPSVLSCTISENKAVINVKTTANDKCVIIVSDCGYNAGENIVFNDRVYEVMNDGTAVVSLIDSTGKSNISRCFNLASAAENGYLVLTDSFYVTNPEIMANHTVSRNDHGIKGILPASTNAEMFNDLGIKQIMFNLEIGGIVSKSSNKSVPFKYNGKDYFFDNKRLSEYDRFVKWCSDNNYQLTFTLLNAASSKKTDLIHPDASDGFECPTYAFNTKTPEGAEHLRAIAAFLAQRYSGGPFGTVDNWILGNQINARTEWYYLKSSNLWTNVAEYSKAYRIFYNEIKAVNANADIYISLDQEWNKKSNPGCFLSREYLDCFTTIIKEGGDIDWCLGIHPYNAPVYDPYAWLQQDAYVSDDNRTPYMTISNIDVLIDHMKQDYLLNPSGKVRKIMLSEIGYTSSFGEDLQAASIAYAYMQASKYPEITGFILFREQDSEVEMSSNIAQGLFTLDGHKKLAYDYYKAVGTPNMASYNAQFTQITGSSPENIVKTFQTRKEWLLDTNIDPAAH